MGEGGEGGGRQGGLIKWGQEGRVDTVVDQHRITDVAALTIVDRNGKIIGTAEVA